MLLRRFRKQLAVKSTILNKNKITWHFTTNRKELELEF